MTTIVKRVVGALLALVGLVLTVTGAWFATQLGTSGTAEFTVRPGTSDPVLIRPDVLNRVEADVVVTATPAEGATVWMALANPSDAAAVVGESRHVDVTGVSVRDWALLTRTTGAGESPELGAADLWRQQDDAEGPVTLTVEQDEAPETLVVATEGGELRSLTFTVVDKTWFVEAVIAVLVGIFLVLAGGALLWPRRERTDEPDPSAADPSGAGVADPAAGAGAEDHVAPASSDPHTDPAGHADPRNPEEVTR